MDDDNKKGKSLKEVFFFLCFLMTYRLQYEINVRIKELLLIVRLVLTNAYSILMDNKYFSFNAT